MGIVFRKLEGGVLGKSEGGILNSVGDVLGKSSGGAVLGKLADGTVLGKSSEVGEKIPSGSPESVLLPFL